MAAECFGRLDVALGKLFEYADEQEATVIIMSDHGHGSLDGKTQPNLLLRDWRYLTLRTPWEQAATRTSYWLHRLTKGKVTRFEQGARGVSVVVTRVTVVFGFPSRHLARQIRHCAILWCGGYLGQQVCGISVSDERRKRQKHEGRSCYERVVKSRRDHAHRSIS